MVVAMVMVSLSEVILTEFLKKMMKDTLLEPAVQCLQVTQRKEHMSQVAINFQKSSIAVRYGIRLMGLAGQSRC